MSFPFDLGDASLVLQVVIFFLLVIGLPFVRWVGAKKNFVIHGRLTFLALIFHVVLVFVAMVPSLGGGSGGFAGFSFPSALLFWSHVVLGTVAVILGFAVIGVWISKPLANMACLKIRKVMMPLLVVWLVSLVLGALVHILKIV
jgi:hypothetical protein